MQGGDSKGGCSFDFSQCINYPSCALHTASHCADNPAQNQKTAWGPQHQQQLAKSDAVVCARLVSISLSRCKASSLKHPPVPEPYAALTGSADRPAESQP
eukprot:1154926-Pelagomonas_calceolata.AAC.2